MILKLKRTPGIYLVGFMGCGKTTIGRLLAEKLGWRFADIDHDVENQAGRSIGEIFDQQGEEEFRRMEHAALADRVQMIEQGRPTVIALGGGAFVRDENFELISDNGISIWLDCPLEILRERVAKESHRPLARSPEKFAELYTARRDSYQRANFRIPVEGDDPDPVVQQMLALPIF